METNIYEYEYKNLDFLIFVRNFYAYQIYSDILSVDLKHMNIFRFSFDP